MKKTFAILLVVMIIFSGCGIKINLNWPGAGAEPESSSLPESSAPELPESSSEAVPEPTPESAAEKILDDLGDLDDTKIKELIDEYFPAQEIPEAFYGVLKPISERMRYELGASKIEGDKAVVDVAVTAVDAKSALNGAAAGIAAKIAMMKLMGQDVSNPEKIVADYITENIDWSKQATIKTNTSLYLVKGPDGEWKIDADNPENKSFLNAISGGAVEVAEEFKSMLGK